MQQRLPNLLETADNEANRRLHSLVEGALDTARHTLGGEQQRLEDLRSLGNVSNQELAAHAAKVKDTMRCLGEARVTLDAVRVIVLDPRE